MSPGSTAASAATIGYTVSQTPTEYVFRPNCAFRTKDCKVRVKEIDGKTFISIEPSRGQRRKLESSVVPGATTLGGMIAVPKMADPSTMTYATSRQVTFEDQLTKKMRTITEQGLWITLGKRSLI